MTYFDKVMVRVWVGESDKVRVSDKVMVRLQFRIRVRVKVRVR